jgi:hypothetical protein
LYTNWGYGCCFWQIDVNVNEAKARRICKYYWCFTLWVYSYCSLLQWPRIKWSKQQTVPPACCLNLSDCFGLVLLFDPEDRIRSTQTSLSSYKITGCHIPDANTLRSPIRMYGMKHLLVKVKTLLILLRPSESQSYFTTGGLSPISSSWRQAPWGSRSEICFFDWALAVIIFM